MGDGEAIALRHEIQAAHARWRGHGASLALRVARAHQLAGAPRRRAVVAQGQRVDPFAFFVAEFRHRAVGAGFDDASIVAASDEAVAQKVRQQYRRVGMRLHAPPRAAIDEQNIAFDQRENRLVADEAGAHHAFARVDGRDAVRQ